MDRYYFYIDFNGGSGYERVTEYDLGLTLTKKRDINDFIQRDYLEGSFKLLGADSTKAQTAFITSSNYALNMRIYEWGVSGVGTLIWSGKALILSRFDFNRNYTEFKSFITTDIYSPILEVLNKDAIWESIPLTLDAETMEDPIMEGLNSNCNKIQTFNYSGGVFSTAGTPYSLPIVGRNAIANSGTGIAIFDALPGSLTRFATADSGLTFTPSTLGTKTYISNADECRSGAVCAYSSAALLYLDDFNNNLRHYTWVTGGWTLNYSLNIIEQKNPELIFLYSGSPSYFALINEKNGTIRRFSDNGSSFSLGAESEIGEIKNAKGALITSSSTNPEIALVDAKTQTLRTYRYDAASGWTKLGSAISLGNVQAPSVCKIDTNLYAVYDNYLGILKAYSWSGSAWSATGTPLTYTGGYYSDMIQVATNRIVMVSSDSVKLGSAINWDVPSLINGICDYHDIYDGIGIGMSRTDHSANFTPTSVFFGTMDTLTDLNLPREVALERVTLKQIFDLIELMFNNFWYLVYDPEGAIIDYQIKFVQPDEFSSIGSNIDVSSLTDDLNIREYLEEIKTDREKMTFSNAFKGNFTGYDIEYSRNTDIQLETSIPVTTDWESIIDNFNGFNKKVSYSGLFAVFGERDSDVNDLFIIEAGTSPISTTNVRNEPLSKTRLQADYLDDYRFASVGNIKVNDSNQAVLNTCRNIIDFPDVEWVFDDYPSALASLNWGSGIYSYIWECQTELKSGKSLIKSRLLDI